MTNAFEPRTYGPERRAFYDVDRRVALLENHAGVPGPEGAPGAAGGGLLQAFWQYASQTASPPGNGTIRTNSPITEMYVSETDTDGYSRPLGLGMIEAGAQVYVRAANGTSANWLIAGPPVDNGTWWTFPVSVLVGTVTKGSRTQINFVTPTSGPWTALPFAGTWHNYNVASFHACGYRKFGDIVYLRGLAQNSDSALTIGTLPAGFRPTRQILFSTHASGGERRIDINTNGTIAVVGGAGPIDYLTLEGIQFSTAAP